MADRWTRLVRAHLGSLHVDPAREADIVEELAQHVAQQHAELIAAGVGDEEAKRRALAPLSDASRLAHEIQRIGQRRQPLPEPPPVQSRGFDGLFGDVRYAARQLRRAPAFAAAAILTLALGIGANAAIFTVLNAVVLRPLAYADPDRLVVMGARAADGTASNVGYTTFLDWRDRSHAFEDMALIRSWSATLIVNDRPERINALRVSANLFRLLGARIAAGRDFTNADDTPGGWQVVILSDGLWRRRFDADPSAIGRVIRMNDRDFTIVGVMPPAFEPLISEHFYQRAEMWAPVGYDRSQPVACRDCEHLKAIGRLRRGVRLDAAIGDIDAVQQQLRREYPGSYRPETMTLVPLRDELTRGARPALAALMGAVGFVLLIACANVANLLLARTAAREHDLALRAALGAGRGRLIRQLMIENGLLALIAGAIGTALAVAAVPLLTRMAPTSMSRLSEAAVDARVLAFSFALSLGTAILFGLLPALRASRVELQASLHGGDRRAARVATTLSKRLLVAGNVAMAVVLLVSAGLMIRSVARLLQVNPGFDPDGVLTLQTSFVGGVYVDDKVVAARTAEMVARMRAMPGVISAAAAGQIPLGGDMDRWGFHVEGRPSAPDDPSVERYSVTPDYFAVMRIPLRRGRLFTDADRAGSENVMLVGEQTARIVFPDADPIGQRVRIGGTEGPFRRIVGIVGDVRHYELAAAPTMQMYLPQAQVTDSFLTFVVRTAGDPVGLAAPARTAIGEIARDVPVYGIAPLADLVERSIATRRFVMQLLELFGAAALLLTAVGVYGVVSYAVTERTRELGIRAALGASRGNIARLVLGGGLGLVSAGLAVGFLLAIAATRFLESSLFGVRATDPPTFAGVAAVLVAITLAAHAVPLARAMGVHPAAALRQE
jgi:putative ABC transport system permease protein